MGIGQVPILDVGFACIPQLKSIERFVARRLGLLGIDQFEAALVDSICELIRELEQALASDESRFSIADFLLQIFHCTVVPFVTFLPCTVVDLSLSRCLKPLPSSTNLFLAHVVDFA